MERIDIVIVCYNCGSDIASLIEEIRLGEYPLDKIRFLIVDNASADNSLAILKKASGIDIRIIESQKNLGFGAGCNLTLDYLSASKTLFLNPDVNLYPDSIKKLLAFSSEHPNAKIWGGRTLNSAGKDDGFGAWREPTLTGLVYWAFFIDILRKRIGLPSVDAYELDNTAEFINADAISGSFFLIETSTFKALNGFDERFFMYSEEIDLCRRARDIGASPKSSTSAKIIHHGSQTLDSINRLNFLYYHKLKYFQKHWSNSKFIIAKHTIRLATLLRLASYSILSISDPSKKPQQQLWLNFLKIQQNWKF